MNLILKSAVSAALLTVAAVSAHAQIAVPTIPTSFPTNGTIGPTGANPSPGNGGLIVQAFDPLTGHSLTEYLGVNFNNFLPGNAVTAAGGSTDFGTIGGTALWNATFGTGATADTNPIDFVVVSANTATSGSFSILTTLSPGTPATQTDGKIGGAASSFASVIGILTAGQQANTGQAAGVNPAQTLATTDNGYGAVTKLGQTFGNNIASIYGTAGGTALNFYQLTQDPDGDVFDPGTSTQYKNSHGAATFSLSANGDLVFNVPGGTPPPPPVPLPAAVWLLGSGLLGLAGIGRRRAAAKV